MKSKITFILKSAIWSFLAVAAIWRLAAFVSPTVYSTKIMPYFLVCYFIIFAGWLLVGFSRRKKEEKRNEKERTEREIGYQARLVRDKETYLAQLPELRQGATETEMRHFQEAFAKNYPNLTLDPDYLDFLRRTNGININGYQLYGTQELMEKNETWEDKAEFVIAEVPEWTFAYDFESQGYCVYDKELEYSGIYGVFDELLVYEILSELIEHLPLTDAELIQKYLNFCLKLRNSIDRDDFTALANAYEKWDANLKMSVKESISPFVWSKINQENFRENQSFRQLKELHDNFYNAWMIKYR